MLSCDSRQPSYRMTRLHYQLPSYMHVTKGFKGRQQFPSLLHKRKNLSYNYNKSSKNCHYTFACKIRVSKLCVRFTKLSQKESLFYFAKCVSKWLDFDWHVLLPLWLAVLQSSSSPRGHDLVHSHHLIFCDHFLTNSVLKIDHHSWLTPSFSTLCLRR